MKILLWLLLFFFVLWLLRSKLRAKTAATLSVAKERPGERMVCCRHCGVHLPVGESLRAGSDHYCNEAHMQAAGVRADPSDDANERRQG